MKTQKKNKSFIYLLLVLIILFSFFRVISQTNEDQKDIGKEIGLEKNYLTINQNVDHSMTSEGNLKLTVKDGGWVRLNGNKLNLKGAKGEIGKSTIVIDKNGEIISGDFVTGAGGGKYPLGNSDELELSQDTKVKISEDKEKKRKVIMDLSSDGKIVQPTKKSGAKEDKETEYRWLGDNLNWIDSEGIFHKVNGGLVWNNKESNFYIPGGTKTNIDGINIFSADTKGNNFKVEIFSDGKNHPEASESYVSLGNNNIFVGSNNNLPGPILEFQKDNRYGIEIDDKKGRFLIQPNSNGEISITNRGDLGLPPELRLMGNGGSVNNGGLKFNSDGNRFYKPETIDKYKDYISSPIDINPIKIDNKEESLLSKFEVLRIDKENGFKQVLINSPYDKQETDNSKIIGETVPLVQVLPNVVPEKLIEQNPNQNNQQPVPQQTNPQLQPNSNIPPDYYAPLEPKINKKIGYETSSSNIKIDKNVWDKLPSGLSKQQLYDNLQNSAIEKETTTLLSDRGILLLHKGPINKEDIQKELNGKMNSYLGKDFQLDPSLRFDANDQRILQTVLNRELKVDSYPQYSKLFIRKDNNGNPSIQIWINNNGKYQDLGESKITDPKEVDVLNRMIRASLLNDSDGPSDLDRLYNSYNPRK